LQHCHATECPSRFVRARGEAPPGWLVDTSGRAEKDDAAWNGSGAGARRLGAQGGGEGATVASPASELDLHLAPSILQQHTRDECWRALRLIVTWGFGRSPVDVMMQKNFTTVFNVFTTVLHFFTTPPSILTTLPSFFTTYSQPSESSLL
jgi:hypothetical protein